MVTPADVTKALARARRHLSAADPELKALMRRTGPCRLRPTPHHFPTLLQSIVGQQLSGARRRRHLGEALRPIPGQSLPAGGGAPRRRRTRCCAASGLSRAKVLSVKDLSAHVLDGRLDLRHLSRQPDAHVIESLVAVRGIGEWTAHMFLMFSLFRLDVLPTGDLGIRKGCQKLYGLRAAARPEGSRGAGRGEGLGAVPQRRELVPVEGAGGIG